MPREAVVRVLVPVALIALAAPLALVQPGLAFFVLLPMLVVFGVWWTIRWRRVAHPGARPPGPGLTSPDPLSGSVLGRLPQTPVARATVVAVVVLGTLLFAIFIALPLLLSGATYLAGLFVH